jgi:hypothetical protein
MIRLAALVLLLPLAACIRTKGSGDPEDPSAFLFAPEHVVQVSISMAPADWDALRVQGLTLGDIFGGPCLAGPFPNPFTYYPATVTVDGETLTNVAVRKKGFLGSLDTTKPSLKIKFDEFVPGREFHGLERLTLNNCKQDRSYLHQALTYQAFARAGIIAPRCNFARVNVNGTDLGLFAHVESVDTEFLRRRYFDDRGNLYAGTLSDFRLQWVNTFDKKTNHADPDRSDLDAVVTALAAPDATVLDALAGVVDIDQFLSFWAMEVLTGHWDGYANNTNNFFAYHDPVSRVFKFMPWGADGAMDPGKLPIGQPTSVFAKCALARRLYLLPTTQAQYLDRLRALLDSVWIESAMLAEIDRMETLITPIADPLGTLGLAAEIDTVRSFVTTRRAAINAELASGPPAWTAPLPDPPCFDYVGSISGTFSTTWGTLGAADPFATGTGTITGTVDGAPLSYLAVGATSGLSLLPPGAMTQVVGLRPDGTVDVVVLVVNFTYFVPGATVPLDWGAGFGGMWNYDPVTATSVMVGFIFNGSVHFNQAGITAGAPVSGTYTGELLKFGP